jgi:hypothetical protein
MTIDSAQFAVREVADDDLDLVHATKNGDVAAFEQLVSDTIANFSELLKASRTTGKIRKMQFRKHF